MTMIKTLTSYSTMPAEFRDEACDMLAAMAHTRRQLASVARSKMRREHEIEAQTIEHVIETLRTVQFEQAGAIYYAEH